KEEEDIFDDDNDLIKELYNNIEMLNFKNTINLEKYINYLEERYITEILNNQKIVNQVTYPESEIAKSNEEDDSIELPQVIHNKALDATHLLELYLLQQDFSELAQAKHNSALLKLSGL
ncbi:8169_t:CDS:1, partial [Dentiscutata erythropus]